MLVKTSKTHKVMQLFTNEYPDVEADIHLSSGGLLVVDKDTGRLIKEIADDPQIDKKYNTWALSDDPASPKSIALYNIKLEYGALLVQLMGNPTREERDTWERQRDWAVRHKNSDATAAPLLVGLLTADERTALGDDAASVMANKILAKNAAAEQLISLSGGIRRTTEKAVEAATSVTDIQDALSAARTSAAQAVAQVLSAQT